MNKTPNTEWFTKQSVSSFARILPRLRDRFCDVPEADWQVFTQRMEKNFGRLFHLLHALYSGHYDFFFHLESIMISATQMWVNRSDDLKALDAMREGDPGWFQSHRMVGYILYADLFAGDLKKIREKIPFL